MKVAVLFEHSGTVRDAFIRAGHKAMSFDILPTESPGPHVQADILEIEKGIFGEYDMVIAHPPCTYMALSGNRWYAGTKKRQESANLIDWVWNIPVEKLCIENPAGQINAYLPHFPKPQYIQPWQFGHGETKKTGFWKRGLPDLIPTDIVEGREQRVWKLGPSEDRWKLRSQFCVGIADAMADQWGNLDKPIKIPAYRPTMRPEWLR